jgi:methionyl-tRNA synthetase
MRKAFITTPIFYVNGAPHLGHAHSLILADVIARWSRFRLGPSNVLLSTGTDEHGKKIFDSARANHQDPQSFCDQISSKFQHLCSAMNTSEHAFIRTTEPRHKKMVEHVWNTLDQRGHLYQGSYSGWYSVSDEEFLSDADTQVTPEGRISKLSGKPVEWIAESNWMFRLSNFQDQLLRAVQQDRMSILPALRKQELVSLLQTSELPDLSVSRPSTRVPWGIPVPPSSSSSSSTLSSTDSNSSPGVPQVVYVWLDALFNYLTVSGYRPSSSTLSASLSASSSSSSSSLESSFWPASHHVIGKDILKFHAIYWPSFLMAMDLPLPQKIICHSHWVVDGRKMSKSLGNVIDPFTTASAVGTDQFRYMLMREAYLAHDANFVMSRLVQRCNAELADTYGNLLSRFVALVQKCDRNMLSRSFSEYANSSASASSATNWMVEDDEKQLFEKLMPLLSQVGTAYENGDVPTAIEHVLSVLWSANALFSQRKPWELVKKSAEDVPSASVLSRTFFLIFESLRLASLGLMPVIPTAAERVLHSLAVADARGGREANVGAPFTTSTEASVSIVAAMQPASPVFPRLPVSK